MLPEANRGELGFGVRIRPRLLPDLHFTVALSTCIAEATPRGLRGIGTGLSRWACINWKPGVRIPLPPGWGSGRSPTPTRQLTRYLSETK